MQHFDEAVRRTTYDDFIATIRNRTELAGLLMTPDAAFGFERRGTPEAVAALGDAQGFDLVVVEPFVLDGASVSSSAIRKAIGAGDLAAAERLLGRPVSLRGEVRDGAVTFGWPLAMPPAGQYASRIDGRPTSVTVRDGTVEYRDAGRGWPHQHGVDGVTESQWHLAQLNVGRLLAPVESPVIAGFVAQLEPINALADADPGMVWRLQTDAGDATSIRPTEDDLFLINMSVWTSLQALRAFTYTTAHVHVLRERRSWFERLAEPRTSCCGGCRPATSRPSTKRSIGWSVCGATARRPPRSRSGRHSNLGHRVPENRWSMPSSAGRSSPRPEVYRPGCQSGSSTPRSWFSNRAITNSASDNRLR